MISQKMMLSKTFTIADCAFDFDYYEMIFFRQCPANTVQVHPDGVDAAVFRLVRIGLRSQVQKVFQKPVRSKMVLLADSVVCFPDLLSLVI